MTSEQIREALRARPFRSFILKTTGGREYVIDHPELAILSQSGRTMSIATPEDTFAILDVLMIESINVVSNGQGRRGKGGRPK
jgi:hypothetical protein